MRPAIRNFQQKRVFTVARPLPKYLTGPTRFASQEIAAYNTFSSLMGEIPLRRRVRKMGGAIIKAYRPIQVDTDTSGSPGTFDVYLSEKVAEHTSHTLVVPRMRITANKRTVEYFERPALATGVFSSEAVVTLADAAILLADQGALEEHANLQQQYISWLNVAYRTLESRGHDMV